MPSSPAPAPTGGSPSRPSIGADWERLCGVLELRPQSVEPSEAERRRGADRADDLGRHPHAVPGGARAAAGGRARGAGAGRADLARDPQLRSRGFIVEIDHRDLGRIEYPGAIERTVRPCGGVKGAVPRLGEHTRDVLAEWAGIEEQEAEALAERGAIWLPDP